MCHLQEINCFGCSPLKLFFEKHKNQGINLGFLMSIPSFSIPVLFWYGSYGSSTKYVFFFHSFVTILSRRFDCCVLQNTCCRSRYFCWEYLVHNFLFLPALVLIHSPELSLLNLFKTSWLDSGLPSVLLHLIVSQSQCILVLTVCTNGLYVCKTGLFECTGLSVAIL